MTDKSFSEVLARPLSLYLGIDLGTSGCRAVAITEEGDIHAQTSTHYALKGDTPAEWWQATKHVIEVILRKVPMEHIQSISIDGTSGTVLLCNEHGKPVSPCLMYNDARAVKQAEELKQHAPADSITLAATSGLAKVLWLIENYPQQETFHVVHQADWVAGMLVQRFNFSDSNNVLKTGYDLENNHWPLWLIDLLKTKLPKHIHPHDVLPQVHAPGEVISSIEVNHASQLGLPFDVDIVSGTTDSTAAFIACDPGFPHQLKKGYAVTSLGSTMVMKVVSDIPVNRPEEGIYSQPYGQDHWLVGGGSNTGGAVLNHFFSSEQIKTYTEQLNPEKETGLHYYPLINKGERFPVNDPEHQPVLTPRPEDDAQFFQGILEGMAEIESRAYRLLETFGAPYPTHVLSAGGGAVNQGWQIIRSKKLGVPVTKAPHTEAAYGIARLAMRPYIKH